MQGTSAEIPEEWRSLFEGRSVAFADLPPPPVQSARGVARFSLRAIPLLLAIALAVGAGIGFAVLSGRWWVGLIVFACVGWVVALLGIGFIGAIKDERAAKVRRRERALEDPIGRLLPARVLTRLQAQDAANYAGLFTLDPRPALVFDVALFSVVSQEKLVPSLAPRGRLPEPEILESSSIPAGTCFIGFMLLFQSINLWVGVGRAMRSGAPIHWSLFGAVGLVGIGIFLIARDPWLRRKLHLPRLFGADAVIGAGWIRDGDGEIWTVDDSIMLVTLAGGAMGVRLIKRTKVRAFFLPIMLGKPGTGRSKKKRGKSGLRARAGAVATDATKGVLQSLGVSVDEGGSASRDMPGAHEPLRLLLLSWTYPEPRTDLAMQA